MACILKEIVKLYLYYILAVHVHNVRTEATQKALAENLSLGQNFDAAMSLAREVGNASAKRAALQAKHIMGPTISAGLDLFETLYAGGSVAERLVRSVGTLFGAYGGGIAGEVGSWVGGRIGLMSYDVGTGIQCLLKMIHV